MNVYITFDYELFLGKQTGSVKACLIRPSQQLLKISEKVAGLKYVFFVDTLYLLKLKEFSAQSQNLNNEWYVVTEQLRAFVEKGHDVQLHLHPQWFYSTFDNEGNRWVLDFEHYKLSDCPIRDVEKMLKESIILLEQIVGYKPTAYRAGGYSFPTEIEYVRLFEKYGISKDSSAFSGKKANGRFQIYDYTNVKYSHTYKFATIPSEIDENGFFTEYPISVLPLNPFRYFIATSKVRRTHKGELKKTGDGKGVGANLSKIGSLMDFFSRFVKPVLMPASIDSSNALWLQEVYESVKMTNSDTMVIIGHPKNCTIYGLRKLEEFVQQNDLNFATFR